MDVPRDGTPAHCDKDEPEMLQRVKRVFPPYGFLPGVRPFFLPRAQKIAKTAGEVVTKQCNLCGNRL
jgi:hypothetical protein